MVLKVVPVQVDRAERHEEVGKRMALSVHQPERHAVFVAAPGQSKSGLQSMAVESSVAVNRPNTMFGVRKSFFHIEQASVDSCPGNGHSQPKSAPASVRGWDECIITENDNVVAPPDYSFRGMTMSSKHETESSIISSLESCKSSGAGAEIIVNAAVRELPSVALNSVLVVLDAGLRSTGSAPHAACHCKPCPFENRAQFYQKKPCIKGSLCDFCHEPHALELRKQERQRVRTEKREALSL